MKKLLLILSLFFGSLTFAQAQTKTTPAKDQLVQVKVLNTYPTPASSIINFDFVKDYNRSYTLTLFNFIGRPVLELKNLNYRNTVTLENFYRGIYIYKLTDRNGLVVESGKFQIVK